MAQNVTVAGASYQSVPAIIVPKTGGGSAGFYDVSDTTATAADVASGKVFHLADGSSATGTASGGGGGGGLVWIKSLTKQTIALANTDYPSWSPSSTATAILATASAGTFEATNVADNDYFTRTRMYLNVVYPAATSTGKGRLSKMVGENWYCITRRASNRANLNSGTRNANVAESITNYWALEYYNSGWVSTYSQSYGIYPANSAPTLSSTSAASPTVTVNRPIINARTSTTYFATTYANALDQDETTITFVFDVYRADATYRRKELQESMIDMWNNGL